VGVAENPAGAGVTPGCRPQAWRAKGPKLLWIAAPAGRSTDAARCVHADLWIASFERTEEAGHQLVEVLVLLPHRLDLAQGVDDGRVVLATEALP